MEIIIVLFYLLLLFITRFIEKTFWSPSAIFILLYSILVIFAPLSKYTTAFGLWVLLSFILSFITGNLLVSSIYKINKKFICNIHISISTKKLINRIYLLYIMLSIIGLFLLIKALNVDISNLFTIEGIIDIAHKSAIARYNENFQTPFVVNILFSFGYCASFISGFFYKELGKFKSILIFIVFLFYTLIYTTKASFLIPLIFWLSSYFLRQLLEYKNIRIKILYIFYIFFIVVIISISSHFFRYGGKIDDIEMFTKHMLVYFVGNITPFTYWIYYKYDIESELFLGQYTFSGLFVLLHLKDPQAGIYRDYMPIIGDEKSNIHTIFRALIEDFSLFTVYVVLFILGLLSKLFYIKIKNCKIIYIPLLLPIYSIILWSPVYSILAYNSLIFAHILFFLLFTFLHRRVKICVKYYIS